MTLSPKVDFYLSNVRQITIREDDVFGPVKIECTEVHTEVLLMHHFQVPRVNITCDIAAFANTAQYVPELSP